MAKTILWRNKTLARICIIILLAFPYTGQGQSNALADTSVMQTGYAPVNGLKLYYEIHGKGKPLLLLHGSFMTINLAFGAMIPELSKTRQVIALELQGHGRTADINRPFSFVSMAEDVSALLQYLKIPNTDVLGYSMGGEVALELAILHPELIHKLVIISSAFNSDGWYPEANKLFPKVSPQMFTGTPIKKEYDRIAPDTAHFADFVNKLKVLLAAPYDFTAVKIKEIKKPAFIIIGDSDGVQPEHATEMFRLFGGGRMGDMAGLPNARLAVIPGATHTSIMTKTAYLLTIIPSFLDAPVH